MSQKMTKNLKRNENSAGGVVFYLDNANFPHILLIMDRFQKWTLPKGHIEEDETVEIAARREIFEETGIQAIENIEELGNIEYKFDKISEGENIEITKQVDLLLFKADLLNIHDLSPNPNEVIEMEWFSPEEALQKVDYKNIELILDKAIKLLESNEWK